MQPNFDEEEEEDFFALLGGSSAKEEVVVQPAALVSPTQSAPQVVEHELSPRSVTDKGPVQQSNSEPHSFEDFKEALLDFYATYNFGNLEKVPYLAEKFFFRRWDLWKQLSIKYRLSPRESSNLWTRFNINFDGIPECTRRLFDSAETITLSTDSLDDRREIWSSILSSSSDTNREQYAKHVAEVLDAWVKDDQSSNCIRIDVIRTHQELSFFQEDSTRNAMVEILSTFCTLNGVGYVQGMNELLGVLFYVFRDASDAFWAFNALMFQLRDIFTAEVDSTNSGIYSTIDQVRRLLADYDYKLSKRLEKSDFPFATISMRWLTTLMAFDLTLPDTMHIWDVALQAIPGHDLIKLATCICTAYLLQMSDIVLSTAEDEDIIQSISSYGKSSAFDVDDLLTKSLAIYAFEVSLRGEYSPSSDEPVLEALGEAVGLARNKVLSTLDTLNSSATREKVLAAIDSVNTDQVKEEVQEKLSRARNFVNSWLSGLATPPKIDPVVAEHQVVTETIPSTDYFQNGSS